MCKLELVRCANRCMESPYDLAARMEGNAKKALSLLRDLYVAGGREGWEEGRTEEDIRTETRIFLDQAARDGYAEAKVK